MSETRTKNRRVLIVSLVVVLGVFGFGYALIPMYYMMMDAMGFNAPAASGAGSVVVQALHKGIDKTRRLTLQFIVTDNVALNLEFRPLIRQVTVNPGEVKEVAYFVKNLTDKEMVLRAIPSVLPGAATKYLARIKSFDKEILKPGEAKTMPLKFVIDSGIPKNIQILTLSYRFIDLTPEVNAIEEQDIRKSAKRVTALNLKN